MVQAVNMPLAIDLATASMYLLAFFVTRRLAFGFCIPFLLASLYLGWVDVELFSARKGGIEFLYYLFQSMIWIGPAILLRRSPVVALCALSMSIYEWLVSIESFVWQFIAPVETPLHSQYALIVLALHLIILSSISRWGGEIGHFTSYSKLRRFWANNL